jgi:RND family efflux transporter MFP subunit
MRISLAFWIGVAALSVAACKKSPPPGPEPLAAAAAAPAVSVRFVKVESRRLPPVLEISGTLDPDERSEVAAQFGGAVKAVNVDVGTRVKKGDVLVVLDSSEAALRLSAAKSTADQQRARLGLDNGGGFDSDAVPDVKAAKDARDLAVLEAERTEKLAKQGAVSVSTADQARTNAERAESGYLAAKNGAKQGFAALKTAEAQSRLSGKNLKDTKVVAPFDGAVQERRVTAGEFAGVGRVVAVVVKDNPLRLKIDVPESEIAGVALESIVTLRVAAFPGRDFLGKVKRIGAAINASSRTLPVEAEVLNDDGLLKPGFFVRAQVSLKGEPADVMLVPESAVGSTGSNARVYVREGSRVIEKLVAVGRSVGGLVEVRGALKPGDEVAADNLGELSDSREVAPR